MRADVAENPAELDIFPEPGRPAVDRACASRIAAWPLTNLVRRDVDRLDHIADCAGLNQLSCLDGGLHLQPFRIHDGVDASGGGDRLAHFLELFERGDAGLVRKKVLARLHAANAQRRALIGDLRTQYQLDRRIVNNFILCRRHRYVRITLLKRGEKIGLECPDFDQNAAPAFHGFNHAVDVWMTDAAHGELDGIARRRIFQEREHLLSCTCWEKLEVPGRSKGGKSGDHACNRDIAEKIAARNKGISHESTRDERFGRERRKEKI